MGEFGLPTDYISEILLNESLVDGLRLEEEDIAAGRYRVEVTPVRIEGALRAEVRFSALAAMAPAEFGWLAIRHETSGRGSATVSTGIDDPGGVSYGAFQMKSRPDGGRVEEFLAAEGADFRPLFGPAAPGSEAFTLAWRKLAADQPKPLFAAELAYIRRSHYDPQVTRIDATGTIRVDDRTAALREVICSTAVQHGPNTRLITGALAGLGGDPADVAGFDRALMQAVYAARIARAPRLRPRYEAEMQDAIDAIADPATVAATPMSPLAPGDAAVPPWLALAFDEFGLEVEEVEGPMDHPRIRQYFTFTTGAKERPDEVPWCGAFLAYCLTRGEAIPPRTGSARAADWLLFGRSLAEPRLGCVVVLKPQDPRSSGHVGFLLEQNGVAIRMISGNISNAVTISDFPADQLRMGGFRWPAGLP